jgi:hypothetical protein
VAGWLAAEARRHYEVGPAVVIRVSVRKGAMVVGGRHRSCRSGWTKKEEWCG